MIKFNEDDYQAALQEYPDGLVISLNRNKDGEYSLHIATCGTLSFDLAAKNQDSRAGKLIFRDQTELRSEEHTSELQSRSDLE